MQSRVLSVTQARSIYLRRISAAKRAISSRERHEAKREVERAAKALQRAQMTARLRGAQTRVPRPLDWNEELS